MALGRKICCILCIIGFFSFAGCCKLFGCSGDKSITEFQINGVVYQSSFESKEECDKEYFLLNQSFYNTVKSKDKVITQYVQELSNKTETINNLTLINKKLSDVKETSFWGFVIGFIFEMFMGLFWFIAGDEGKRKIGKINLLFILLLSLFFLGYICNYWF